MTLMRSFSFALMWMIAITTVALPVSVKAQSGGEASYSNDIPLVVLRYNQPRIYYDKQLYNAVSKAVAIKPSVVFSVVSFIPEGASEDDKERNAASANQQLSQLVASMKKMGIPSERINISKEFVNDARFHEIYIYVD